MLVLIIAIISLPFIILYGLVKFLLSDTFHEGTNKIEKKVSNAEMEFYKATKDFNNSPEGQATLSVIESAAEHYREREGLDPAPSYTTTDKDTSTTTSTQTSTTATTSNPLSDLQRDEKNKLERGIREQGVDPYDPAHDTDIEALLEDIEDTGRL